MAYATHLTRAAECRSVDKFVLPVLSCLFLLSAIQFNYSSIIETDELVSSTNMLVWRWFSRFQVKERRYDS